MTRRLAETKLKNNVRVIVVRIVVVKIDLKVAQTNGASSPTVIELGTQQNNHQSSL